MPKSFEEMIKEERRLDRDDERRIHFVQPGEVMMSNKAYGEIKRSQKAAEDYSDEWD